MLDNDFEFYFPVDIVKGTGDDNGKMKLAGIASTADTDRQGENLMPEGFDYSYLLSDGYINWHHQMNKDPEAVIGEPTKAKITKDGLYIECELYPSSDMAKKAYNLTRTLATDSKKRKMGWSIEGKVIERDPNNKNKVLKAKITGVALTPMPISPKTFVDIIKGMDTDEVKVAKAAGSKGNGGDTKVINFGGKSIELSKGEGDDIVVTFKGMNTTNGRAVMKESVEGGTKPNVDDDDKEVFMSKSEAYEYMFATYPKLSMNEVQKVVDEIVNSKN